MKAIAAAKGKCPKCEKGVIFRKKGTIFLLKLPVMNDTCPNCNYKFELEPGHFIGAMYVSYALVVGEGIGLYFVLAYFVTSITTLLILLFLAIILLSFFNFRYSRIIWIYFFS
ncbi:MAG: DUF983 domain-containing protein [Flavobacteriales bacterium]|jgi:uncharacterized protein (DUF983 family)|nr:DUF983 domain-containing protein [Flavobacteriales bacterium]